MNRARLWQALLTGACRRHERPSLVFRRQMAAGAQAGSGVPRGKNARSGPEMQRCGRGPFTGTLDQYLIEAGKLPFTMPEAGITPRQRNRLSHPILGIVPAQGTMADKRTPNGPKPPELVTPPRVFKLVKPKITRAPVRLNGSSGEFAWFKIENTFGF